MAGEAGDRHNLRLFEPFFTVNHLPYTREDVILLNNKKNVMPLVQKYWPDRLQWLLDNGFTGGGISAVYDISKAAELLSWTPRYNFDEWAGENIG